jgi:hypothetical protein
MRRFFDGVSKKTFILSSLFPTEKLMGSGREKTYQCCCQYYPQKCISLYFEPSGLSIGWRDGKEDL